MKRHVEKTEATQFKYMWNQPFNFKYKHKGTKLKEGDEILFEEFEKESDKYTGREILGYVINVDKNTYFYINTVSKIYTIKIIQKVNEPNNKRDV